MSRSFVPRIADENGVAGSLPAALPIIGILRLRGGGASLAAATLRMTTRFR